MSRAVKILFAVSAALYLVSYPVCQYGERKVQSEMDKYPADFVSEHYFDFIFLQHALPGISLFFLAGAVLLAALIAWFVEWLGRRRVRKTN
jgi:hypothetical protein